MDRVELPELFPPDRRVGVFRGFRDGGLEFRADLTLPYRSDFHNKPMHGQFVLVELDNNQEAILGRIASLSSDGKLTGDAGEEYNIRAMQESRVVPDDIRRQYLRYRVNIRVLGVLSVGTRSLTFVPSQRRLPPAGSAVAFPSEQVLRWITGHYVSGALIGHLALGEYFYGPAQDNDPEWLQPQPEHAEARFPVETLVARRTFIFARAGFGKSNLAKLLFSSLYETPPTITKRGGREVPVGTVLFDPDGEYFWPDDKGRPGLCDVDHMTDTLVVFTARAAPSEFYGSFTAGGVKLDLRRLPAGDVIGTFLAPDRQQQQNVIKMRSMNPHDWRRLVDLIHNAGNNADLDEVRSLLKLTDSQEMEALAARANATRIVNALHDPSSLLLDALMAGLKAGKLCIVDVSLMSSEQALVLSGLVLKHIFDHNQREFTAAHPDTIPTIAVVEEAQAVLNDKAAAAQPYISWVKEGRKYDLGAVLVTQQPGSIPKEILSQGDNWFLFHLLSAGDLHNVNAANAHFGTDILASLLNEPIPGQGVFWSSASQRSYPVPVRIRNFEASLTRADPDYTRPAAATYAQQLRHEVSAITDTPHSDSQTVAGDDDDASDVDVLQIVERAAIQALKNDPICDKIRASGAAWGTVKAILLEHLPQNLADRDQFAFRLVAPALTEIFGEQGQHWETYKTPNRNTTWVRVLPSGTSPPTPNPSPSPGTPPTAGEDIAGSAGRP